MQTNLMRYHPPLIEACISPSLTRIHRIGTACCRARRGDNSGVGGTSVSVTKSLINSPPALNPPTCKTSFSGVTLPSHAIAKHSFPPSQSFTRSTPGGRGPMILDLSPAPPALIWVMIDRNEFVRRREVYAGGDGVDDPLPPLPSITCPSYRTSYLALGPSPLLRPVPSITRSIRPTPPHITLNALAPRTSTLIWRWIVRRSRAGSASRAIGIDVVGEPEG